jgi:hypothetical protein
MLRTTGRPPLSSRLSVARTVNGEPGDDRLQVDLDARLALVVELVSGSSRAT